jgi:hypothetical protein
MRCRDLLLAALFAGGLAGAATVAVDTGIAVKESDVATPVRGMTMSQVAAKFGTPVTKVAAVGKPPISRWEYPGFVVYFEADHVIHSVIPSGTAPSSAAPPADATPADATPADATPADATKGTAPASDAPSSTAPNS